MLRMAYVFRFRKMRVNKGFGMVVVVKQGSRDQCEKHCAHGETSTEPAMHGTHSYGLNLKKSMGCFSRDPGTCQLIFAIPIRGIRSIPGMICDAGIPVRQEPAQSL